MTAQALRADGAGRAVRPAPWAVRRERAEALRERYPFAREPLALYRALVDTQEAAWAAARRDPLGAADLCEYGAARVLPGVIAATIAAGPRSLADILRAQFAGASAASGVQMIRRWLDGDDQPPVERYLARASGGPLLEALGERAGEASGGGRTFEDGRGAHCPVCGGPPQLTVIAAPAESLVSGLRSLVCSRCAAAWPYPRLTCAACGEQATANLTVLAEEGTDERALSGSTVRGLRGRPETPGTRAGPRFPHMRIDACTTCSRYLVSIDLGRDPRAVPLVDELAAIPLDLHAVGSGFTKVVPNLMGA
ncbi:MAG TPA: formate dehydrogenase accessory protein FdhE [bacterium]|nr:formate dehydrogenase accessory protein FdhE [bacterium]